MTAIINLDTYSIRTSSPVISNFSSFWENYSCIGDTSALYYEDYDFFSSISYVAFPGYDLSGLGLSEGFFIELNHSLAYAADLLAIIR